MVFFLLLLLLRPAPPSLLLTFRHQDLQVQVSGRRRRSPKPNLLQGRDGEERTRQIPHADHLRPKEIHALINLPLVRHGVKEGKRRKKKGFFPWALLFLSFFLSWGCLVWRHYSSANWEEGLGRGGRTEGLGWVRVFGWDSRGKKEFVSRTTIGVR